MIILSSTEYITLDTSTNTIEDVQLVQTGAAMSATYNAGNVPVGNNPLKYVIKSPNPALGDVLVV